MSGVEIVGLLLGAFPLLISAAEHYKEGFEGLAKWYRFRDDFVQFIDTVATQKLLFDQTVERFLISADIPDDELQQFMRNPNYEGWHRMTLSGLLRARLGPAHEVFMSTIERMNKLLLELQEILMVKTVKNGMVEWEVEWARDGASQWNYQMKRIYLSFSKKGNTIVEELERHNKTLAILLDLFESKDGLDRLKTTRKDATRANIMPSLTGLASNSAIPSPSLTEDKSVENDKKADENKSVSKLKEKLAVDLAISEAENMRLSTLEAYGEAKYDSGIGSMPDTVSKSKEQDDDKLSIRSILTNASRVVLPPQEKEYLISAFVGDLCQDIVFRGDLDARDRLYTSLSDLLKTFTMRLEESANSKTELDAKEFVGQQRHHIAHQFCKSQMPAEMLEDEGLPTPSEDGMSPVEKMAFWNTTEHSDLAPFEQVLDEVQEPPRYQEVRSFLLDGLAYQWLVENARSSALLTERKGTILEAITCMIDDKLSSMRTPKSRRFQVFQVIFEMDWDLLNFLRGQEYDTTMEIAVERAITVTGSSSSAQALSCCLVDGTELDINLRSPKALVVARGGQAALTELGGQLSWLGAALRTSPVLFGIYFTTPSIVAFKVAHSSISVPSMTVQLGFTTTSSLDHGQPTDVDGTCWHAMFRNPVVVNGFPILARHENEQGLELPLNMMSALAEAHFVTRYDAVLILKGLCTMLVPTGQTERSVTWHFIFNEDGERLPYYSFRERCPGWIDTDKVSANFLEDKNVRNFVGWASNIMRYLGTEEMKYGEIDCAGARECSAGLAVEQKLTISVSKIVGGSGSVVRGNRDKPVYVKQSAYSMQIKNARNIFVVLYDVAARRGVGRWGERLATSRAGSLFNNPIFNASAFNHPRIDSGPNAAADILKEDRNMKHIILREFDSYSDEKLALPKPKAVSTAGEHSGNEAGGPSGNETPNPGEGRKEIYKTTCLRELVSQTWSTLEQIYDRQIEYATTHNAKELQNPLRTTLEGYEFMDIVSAEHILTQRTVSFQSNGVAWTGLTKRIHAITLFGQYFGDIYKPAENERRPTCENWKTVPQGHEYLAAPISLLKEIKEYSWKKGKVDKDSSEIAEGLLWSPSEDAYNICGSSCKHTFNRVQQLHSSTTGLILDKLGLGKNDPQKVDNFAEIHGAVLFGKNSDLDAGKLQLLSPREVHMENDRSDSGLGLSLQTSSQANLATESCNESLDLQPARPSAGSTRTSPYPLDQTGAKNMSTQDVPTLVSSAGRRRKLASLPKTLAKMIPRARRGETQNETGRPRE
ncbi:hypothetical protein F5884DRAFT_887230 [Xylogone sp. PMI_703]|nr:hypothetical protein F5884DRAFT_887230 [Xylogone sp. PMI_703]